ncbi:MAG: hypothetical protein K6A34_06305 [Methanobrevibacter sp.]|nr:hypothetical protein [Methanobrevibacter sp.]
MPCTVELFVEEVKFLESVAKDVLKENAPDGWYINTAYIATLDISKATVEQRAILRRRLGGYGPRMTRDRCFINLNRILGLAEVNLK